MDAKQRIARRVAQELRDGDIVNLGIGLPTMVANYLPEGIHITLQSENGFLGLGPVTTAHPDLVNAGGQPCGVLPGGWRDGSGDRVAQSDHRHGTLCQRWFSKNFAPLHHATHCATCGAYAGY